MRVTEAAVVAWDGFATEHTQSMTFFVLMSLLPLSGRLVLPLALPPRCSVALALLIPKLVIRVFFWRGEFNLASDAFQLYSWNCCLVGCYEMHVRRSFALLCRPVLGLTIPVPQCSINHFGVRSILPCPKATIRCRGRPLPSRSISRDPPLIV